MRDVLLGNQRNTQEHKNLTAAGPGTGLESRLGLCPALPAPVDKDKDKDKDKDLNQNVRASMQM